MPGFGFRDPVTLVLTALAMIGGIVALRSWGALQHATYDRKSLATNRYSLMVGLIIFGVAAFLEYLWLQWLQEAISLH